MRITNTSLPKHCRRLSVFASGFGLLGIPATAIADTAILDAVVAQFEAATSGWYATLFPIARNLFILLATIELIVSAMWWAIDRDSLPSVFTAFLKRMVALSFFFMVLLNANTWIPALLSSFQTAGATAGGVPNISPSSVVGQGIDLASVLLEDGWSQGLTFNLKGAFLGVLCALFLFIAFVVIAAQYVITLVELYIVIGGGVLLLGFSGSRWSIGFAEKYIGYAFATGVKLFVLLLIIGVGSGLALGWRATLVDGDFENMLAVVAAGFLYMGIAWQVPSFASAMIGGMPALTLGSTVGPAATLGAAAAGGMGVAALGAARVAGGMSATKAATQYGRVRASNAGGGAILAVGHAAGVLAREGMNTVGRGTASRTGAGQTAAWIRERTAAEGGPAVPPPRRSSPPKSSRSLRTRAAALQKHLDDRPPAVSPPPIRTGE